MCQVIPSSMISVNRPPLCPAGISVVLDLTPNYQGSSGPWFSNISVTNVAERLKVRITLTDIVLLETQQAARPPSTVNGRLVSVDSYGSDSLKLYMCKYMCKLDIT